MDTQQTERERLEARLSAVRGQLAAASGTIRAATMALVEAASTDALEELAGALLQSAALGQVAEELGAMVKRARIAELETLIAEKQALIKTKHNESEAKRHESDAAQQAIARWDRMALKRELPDGGLAERVQGAVIHERLILEGQLIKKELGAAKNDLFAAEEEVAALRGEREAAHWSLAGADRAKSIAEAALRSGKTTSAAGQ